MVGCFTVSELLRDPCQCGPSRRAAADVPQPSLIVTGIAEHQCVPVDRAESRPCSDGANIDAIRSNLLRRPPSIAEPTELLVARTSHMNLGDRHRKCISLARLAQSSFVRADQWSRYPHAFDIDIVVAPVVVAPVGRIQPQTVVQKALAGDITVDSDDVGRTRLLRKAKELVLARAVVEKIFPKRMAWCNASR